MTGQWSQKSAAKSQKNRAGTLRIIGGQWRGRKLHFIERPGLRPTLDRVRETLFNWLAADIQGARCLDLFAGSGALGIEALSRGAGHVSFVEKDSRVAAKLKSNLQLLKVEREQASVHNLDAFKWLGLEHQQPYDIIFLDPPFYGQMLTDALEKLVSTPYLMRSESVIYMENEKEGIDALSLSKLYPLKHKKTGSLEYALYHVKQSLP